VAFLFLGFHMDDTAISSVWTFLSFFTHEEIDMHANTTIINCLKKHGQLLDHEISAETGIPLRTVRDSLSDLSERGEISRCSVTRFDSGKPVKGSLCRIAGYAPTWATNRKAAAKTSS
jgi:transcription initiation factor IIE alpha subunit